jgi:mannose-6-phosphate isomerase
MGVPLPGEPEAELWFGPHPLSDCMISVGDTAQLFSTWLEDTGHSFPLLVKFLAASKPLSIQVHPNRDAAEKGFAKEQAAGVPIDASQRTFKDPHPKPELLIPLSATFDVVWGVQDAVTLTHKLQRWQESGLASRTATGLQDLCQGPLEDAGRFVLSGHPDVMVWLSDLAAWSMATAGAGSPVTEFERSVIRRLVENFPGDLGVVVATLMHQRRLHRGEAIFVKPGEIHAYVEGFALEVMLPSDNVARAGLTTKHVDPEVFFALADFTPSSSIPVLSGTHEATGIVFDASDIPFTVTEITGGLALHLPHDAVLVVEEPGLTQVVGGVSHPLKPGCGYFVAHADGPHQISGRGTAWLVQPQLGN